MIILLGLFEAQNGGIGTLTLPVLLQAYFRDHQRARSQVECGFESTRRVWTSSVTLTTSSVLGQRGVGTFEIMNALE